MARFGRIFISVVATAVVVLLVGVYAETALGSPLVVVSGEPHELTEEEDGTTSVTLTVINLSGSDIQLALADPAGGSCSTIAGPNLAANTTRELTFALPASCEIPETGIELGLHARVGGADIQVLPIVASVPDQPAPSYGNLWAYLWAGGLAALVVGAAYGTMKKRPGLGTELTGIADDWSSFVFLRGQTADKNRVSGDRGPKRGPHVNSLTEYRPFAAASTNSRALWNSDFHSPGRSLSCFHTFGRLLAWSNPMRPHRIRVTPILMAILLLAIGACTAAESTESSIIGSTTNSSEGSATSTDTGESTTTPPPVTEETSFSFGTVEPTGIDPALTADLYGMHVVRVVFDGLTDIGDELAVVPAVAESWETTDNTTWTFHLRDDVTFTNGRQVVAEDFVASWTRAAHPDTASPVGYHGLPISGWAEVMDGAAETIAGVRAIDDLTLEVVTSQSFALLPKVLAHPVFSPVPAEDTDEAFADQPIGNGPYMLEGPWEHQVRIPLIRNPDYYGTPGASDRIEVRLYSGIDPMVRDVQGGNLDLCFQCVSPGLISTARTEFGDRLLSVPTGSVAYIMLPTTVDPYSNVDLRRALSLAIDREAIAERIWAGTVTPAAGLVPPQAEGAVADGCEWCVFDPARAAELYEASGLPGGVTKIYHDPSLNGEDAEAIANGWRSALGVEVELVPMEFDPLVELLYTGVSDGVVIIGWIWDYPSAYSFLSPLLESTSGDNTGLWVNEQFDSLMEQARTAPTEEEAIPHLEEAQRIFGSELPLIPLYFFTDLSVYNERVENVVEDAYGFIYLEDIRVTG